MNNDIIELTAKEVLRHLDINLNQARQLIDAVMKKADEMGVKAVCAVANSAGRPVAVECMDGAYIASYDVALNKSFTVTALKMSTIDLKPLARPFTVFSLPMRGKSLFSAEATPFILENALWAVLE